MRLEEKNNGSFLINSDFADLLRENGIDSAEALWGLKGESVKAVVKERVTERAFLKTPDGRQHEIYLKRYRPLPLKEYFKCAGSLMPVFTAGAIHEWEAILALHRENIPTMTPIAAGRLTAGRTVNITLGIDGYRRASDIFAELPDRATRSMLIENIAKLAGRMHVAKFAHQDFYLVHLFVKDDLQVLPIDLQRLIMGKRFKRRWQMKDLAQLLYSAHDVTSRTDRLRFWKIYTDAVDEDLYRNKRFIASVIGQARRIRVRSEREKKRENAEN